ncbi:hypothetical protein FN846DRAFT_949050 [Sphaerosporella brunnea]|uniref:Uncharacterized protein n=1 Tax=Sphaerosporella brunnea TaxID=1250544 RepID=A0A5J5EWP9_9PEZI|nr:hypothetical protein FN846DRAFT_949050 [Sphaerosporella brunnea]
MSSPFPSPSPLATFFTSFASLGFTYNSRARTDTEYRRLRKQSFFNDSIKAQFHAAFEQEFDALICDGRRLCEILGVEPIPESQTQKKKALAGIHVNIYDLLEYARKWALDRDTAGTLKRFGNVKELANYSKARKRIYPRDEAKGQGALRFMLRVLFGRR